MCILKDKSAPIVINNVNFVLTIRDNIISISIAKYIIENILLYEQSIY